MKIMGKKKKVIVERMRERPDASEVSRLYSSNKKAKKLMGWEPDYGGKKGFEKALKETIEWYKKNRNKFSNSDYII